MHEIQAGDERVTLVPLLALPRSSIYELLGEERREAEGVIRARHYTRSTPSGKSHYLKFDDALIVWSLPANKNLGGFLINDESAAVWELSRLWAPDGHEPNLLTRAISAAVKAIRRLEHPDLLVSFADPNAGHLGGVYRAASWIYCGTSNESRAYEALDGTRFARRAFHSGSRGMTRAQIEAAGYQQVDSVGKERFAMPMNRRTRRALQARLQTADGRG